jgi:hypothetical protein
MRIKPYMKVTYRKESVPTRYICHRITPSSKNSKMLYLDYGPGDTGIEIYPGSVISIELELDVTEELK